MKNYSKKQLAQLIIEANPDIFIPIESLIESLDSIYKIRKIARKILDDLEYDKALLRNMIIVSNNAFGNKPYVLYKLVMNEQELDAVKEYL